MHAELLAQFGQLVLVAFTLKRDEHADLAEVRSDCIVHIGHDDAVGDRNGLHAADLLVLADGRNIVGQLVADGATGRIVGSLQRFHVVTSRAKRDLGGLADEILELVVLGNEVGFRVHFDGNTLGAFDGNADETFGGSPARLLLSSGEALGAQCVDRSFDIAVCGFECLLGVHHARAGLFTEGFYVSGSECSHGIFLLEMMCGHRASWIAARRVTPLCDERVMAPGR